jgi:hypothetical protein
MKVVLPKKKDHGGMVVPPIPLVKSEEKAYEKGSYVTMKLRSSPADEHSPTHEIQVPYFKAGTCESFLDFCDKTKSVFIGQNMTTGPQKYTFFRSMLKGDALATFNNAAVVTGAETNPNFELCLRELAKNVFPKRALRIQKRYMRRYMRKPREMKMREYRNRVIELNGYLERFPNSFNAAQKLEEEEITDILEFGTPKTWQKELVKQGMDSTEMTTHEMVEFCERLEFIEDLESHIARPAPPNDTMPGPRVKPGRYGGSFTDAKSQSKSSRAEAQNNYKKRKTSFGPAGNRDEKYCELHGVYGHDLSTCKVMRDQAKKMKSAWDTMNGSRGPVGAQLDKRYAQKQQQKEIHSIVQSAVKEALQSKAGGSKKRKSSAHVNFTDQDSDNDYDGVDEFANLTLDDYNSDDDDLEEFSKIMSS